MLAGDFVEHRLNGSDVRVFARLAESLDGGQVAVAVLRPQEGDALDRLNRPRTADEFAEDRLERDFRQGTFVRFEDVAEHFLFAGCRKDLAAAFGLHLADLRGNPGPLGYGQQDVEIEFVDLPAELLQVAGGAHGAPDDAIGWGVKFYPTSTYSRVNGASTNRRSGSLK